MSVTEKMIMKIRNDLAGSFDIDFRIRVNKYLMQVDAAKCTQKQLQSFFAMANEEVKSLPGRFFIEKSTTVKGYKQDFWSPILKEQFFSVLRKSGYKYTARAHFVKELNYETEEIRAVRFFKTGNHTSTMNNFPEKTVGIIMFKGLPFNMQYRILLDICFGEK